MTQAPERIWANSSYKDNHAYGWWRNGPFEAGEGYIRKDVSDARIAELEAVAARFAELDAALEEVKQYTDAMSINGIVSMCPAAYAMMCNALSKESEG